MTITLVSAGALSINSTTTVTPAFGQATTAGNLLVAMGGNSQGGGVNSNTTTAAGWIQASAGSMIWYKPNCGAGESAPTFTNGSATAIGMALYEFSSVKTSSPLEATGAGSNTVNPQSASTTTIDVGATNLVCFTAGYTISKSSTPSFSGLSFTPGTIGSQGSVDSTATKLAFHLWTGWAVWSSGGNSGHAAGSLLDTPSTGSFLGGLSNIATFKPAIISTSLTPAVINMVGQAVNRAANF